MPVPGTGGCFKCGQPGHWLDNCPYSVPATSRAEHDGRIRTFIDMWIDGRIDALRKRQLISDENAMWNGVKPKRERKTA